MNYISSILAELKHLDQNVVLNKELTSQTNPNRKNEFLLILKPEIFISKDEMQLKSILELVTNKLEKFDLHIDAVRIQNANYLKSYNVIDQHYGVINAVARNLKQFVTKEATQNFKSTYNLNLNNAPVFGALELLKSKVLDAPTLNKLWKDCEIKRLGGGIYCGKVEFKGKDLYIANGFHPPQLEHFIADNRLIITMNVSSNTDWNIARKKLVGNTYPEKAKTESIRGALYKKYGNYGFDKVSYVINSVHLSAGPLEGLIELQRFNSAFEKNKKAAISDFSFGRMLQENFTDNECENILTNPTVQFENKSISLFDLTEEMNSKEAIDVLKKIIK